MKLGAIFAYSVVLTAVLFMGVAFVEVHSLAKETSAVASTLETVAAEHEAAPITPAEARVFIEQGNAIMEMALDEFATAQDIGTARALLELTDQYNYMLGALCDVGGNEALCANGVHLIGTAYTVLMEFTKTLE